VTAIGLSRADFEPLASGGAMLVVHFRTASDAPCRAFARTFELASDRYPDLAFGEVDIEAEPALATMFGIRSVPTLLIVRENVVLYAEAGAPEPGELESIIVRARALDMAAVRREIEAGRQCRLPTRTPRRRSANAVRVTGLRVAHARARAMGIEEISVMRTDVDEAGFDAFVTEHAIALVLIQAQGQFAADQLEALAQVCERTAMPSALAIVDPSNAPGILAMFGVVQTPYLLIFRDRVALFAEPVAPTPAGLEKLLAQIEALDMEKVRQDIDAERRARDALLTRRACPTLRSGPASTRD